MKVKLFGNEIRDLSGDLIKEHITRDAILEKHYS